MYTPYTLYTYVYIMSCANYVIIKPIWSATVQNFNLYWGHLAGPIHSIPKPPVPQWHEVLPWARRRQLHQYRLGFAWANLNIATQSLPLAFIIPSRGLIMMMNKRRRRRRRSSNDDDDDDDDEDEDEDEDDDYEDAPFHLVNMFESTLVFFHFTGPENVKLPTR